MAADGPSERSTCRQRASESSPRSRLDKHDNVGMKDESQVTYSKDGAGTNWWEIPLYETILAEAEGGGVKHR